MKRYIWGRNIGDVAISHAWDADAGNADADAGNADADAEDARMGLGFSTRVVIYHIGDPLQYFSPSR